MNLLSMRYLYLVPYTFQQRSHQPEELHSPKGAPYFFEHDIDIRSYDTMHVEYEETPIEIVIQVIDDTVLLYDCHYQLAFPDKKDAIHRNHTIQETIKNSIHSKLKLAPKTITEEYTIVLITQTEHSPDTFISDHKHMLAGLIRTFYDKTLDTREIDDILTTRIRYSDQDSVVLDWNGAVIVTNDGEFTSDIDLLKIGNYQLIRYRMLDHELEKKLNHLREVLGKRKNTITRNEKKILEEIVQQRLSILLTFEKLDTSMLLIGDWYSANFYRAMTKEFYVDTWKTMVQSKLDNLKSLHEMISEHMTISWRRLIDQITFIGWFVMMLGYMFLFFTDIVKRQ